MIKTSATRLHGEYFRLMQDQGLMVPEYDTAEEMAEAYLQADWLVRERAGVPQMPVEARERVRGYLLGVLRQDGHGRSAAWQPRP